MAFTTEDRNDVIALAVAVWDAAPGAANLSELAVQFNAGASMLEITEALTQAEIFTNEYPAFQTNAEFAAEFVANVVGGKVSEDNEQWAVDQITAQLNAGASQAEVILGAIEALQAVPEDDENWGDAAAAFNNKIEVATYYSVTLEKSAPDLAGLKAIVANVDETEASVTAAKAAADNAGSDESQSFTFTTGVDEFVGGDANDTFTGTDTTITALDEIDGGAGIDTLKVNDTAGTADLSLLTMTNVEKLNLASVAGLNGGAADVSGFSGLTDATFKLQAATAAQTVTGSDTVDLTVTNSAAQALTINGGNNVTATNGAAAVAVNGAGGLESASVTGGTTVDIDDSADDTLTSASISGNTGAATVKSDALTNLTVSNTGQAATVTAAAGTRALDLTLNNVSGGATIQDSTATSATVTGSTKASNATLDFGAATALTLSGDKALTLALANQAAGLDITSNSTGGVTISTALNAGVDFTGGEGKETITLANGYTGTAAMGAGDDKVTLSAALGTGGSVAGGEGVDTLVVDAAAFALTGTSGFEVLGLGANATGAYDASGFASLTHGAVTGAVTYNNVAAGTDLTITAAPTQAATYTLADATGSSDVLDLKITNAAAIDANTLTAGGVETINVESDQVGTATGIAHTLNIAGNDAKTITVSGDAGVALTAGSTALTSFDASAVTKGAVTWTTGALAAAADIKGGQGANTIDFSAATKAVTYTGAGGVDTVVANNSNNTINTGGGNDVITLGTGVNTVNAGAGNDTINMSTGLDVITGGAGDDTFVATAPPANGNSYTTITDFAGGDALDLSALDTVAMADATVGAAITLAGTAVFQDYLDSASAGTNAGTGASVFNWFEFDGDTYVVVDDSDNATFDNGTDSVIKLSGAVDLAGADITTSVLTL